MLVIRQRAGIAGVRKLQPFLTAGEWVKSTPTQAALANELTRMLVDSD
jgi:hypothetical protein